MKTRRQLTLFIENETIEKIRTKFNPIQAALIPAHVTLCREDELEDLQKVLTNIKALRINKSIQITFSDVERFENGKGVLIPASERNDDFHNLRMSIIDSPRKHLPHVTLMHPRNSTCTEAIFEEIKSYQLPKILAVNRISLIEQTDGGDWEILDEFLIY